MLDDHRQRSRQRSNRGLRASSRLLGRPDQHPRHRPATCSMVRSHHHRHVARAQIPIAPSRTLSAPSPAISSLGQLPTPAVGACSCVPWPASATLHTSGHQGPWGLICASCGLAGTNCASAGYFCPHPKPSGRRLEPKGSQGAWILAVVQDGLSRGTWQTAGST